MPQTNESEPSQALAIFGRLLRAEEGDLSKELAKFLLTLGFDATDQQRMLELAERNQEGALKIAERQELAAYAEAGHLLALLHAKARRSIKSKGKR